MVTKVMGHTDVRTSMRYQHSELVGIRGAIDQRNLIHNPRHNELTVQRRERVVIERMEPTIGLEPMTCRLWDGPSRASSSLRLK
jgi:hypothetical protein